MAWNPDTYNKFKSERFAPFYDLLDLVAIRPGIEAIDLGCGTGELTRKLADALPESKILGIDSSEEMLNDSKNFVTNQLQFAHRSIEEQLKRNQKWDLVFSNAAIQWVENHEKLFPGTPVFSLKTEAEPCMCMKKFIRLFCRIPMLYLIGFREQPCFLIWKNYRTKSGRNL